MPFMRRDATGDRRELLSDEADRTKRDIRPERAQLTNEGVHAGKV